MKNTNKLILGGVILFVIVLSIFAFIKYDESEKNRVRIEEVSKCWDGICLPIEKKSLDLCPQDCGENWNNNDVKVNDVQNKCWDWICDTKEINNPGLCSKDCEE